MIIKDINEIRSTIRRNREQVCFPVINRGKLWYDRLSSEQISELKQWYQSWLDAPEKLEFPKTPEWVNQKTYEEEIII